MFSPDQWIAAAQVYATMALALASAVDEGSSIQFHESQEFLGHASVCLDEAGITDAVDEIEDKRHELRIDLLRKLAAAGNKAAIDALRREGITDA